MDTPDARTDRKPSAPSPGRLYGLARPYLGGLLLATGIMLLASTVGLVAPSVAGKVMDAALLERGLSRLDTVAFALIGLFAVLGFLQAMQLYLGRRNGALLLRDLRTRLYTHLLHLAPDFFETRRVGELQSRIGSDLTLVQSALTSQIPDGIRAVFTLLGTVGILLVLHTRLTLLALGLVPPIVLIGRMYGKRLEKLSKQVQDALADASAVAEEALSGVRTVQSFRREAHEKDRYDSRIGKVVTLQIRNARIAAGFMGLIHFAAFSSFALVLWYGGRLIQGGEMTPGQLTAFLLYTFSVAGSVGTLGGLYGGYREMRGASARIFEILDTRPSIEDRPDAAPLRDPHGRIELHGLSFRYPTAEGRTALDGVELSVEPGEMVGVVGPSGAGKSTLFALLLRFRDAAEGSISIGGQDLRSVRLEDLRRAIGIVPQEIVLFSGTVEENIRYGRLESTPEEVRAAAVAAGADGFIRELPRGYDELVGERGVKLSAGQRQRIAIARVFLKDPAIVLLDEATSSLDPESEEVVQQALGRLLRGRTTLVIAHRLATARRASRIVVLERGRVAGIGTHEELYVSSELYRHYWELQSLHLEGVPEAAGG
jgi:ATP-binding cassette, subfamily B, bacterial MsbA